MIGSTLRRYQPEHKALCWDAETEGLNLFVSRPWQLAWIIADAKEIFESYDFFIWFADLKVSAQAAAVTGFDYRLYKERARPPLEVLGIFEERLYDVSLTPVGQNIFYDAYIHKTLRRLCGKKPDWSWMTRMVDTNALSKSLRKGWTPDTANLLPWLWKTTSCHERLKTKLGQMCAELEIPFDERQAHNAIYDVIKTHELYRALLWKCEV